MIKLLASLIMIVILIIFHEFGHFIVAKLMGVRVTCFSLGFGPKLISFTIGDTEYRISLIPLGGYISIYGYDENEVILEENKKFSFMHQAVYKKILIAFAGPFFNLILPFILIILLFSNSNILKTPVFINKSIDSFLLENHLYEINKFYIDDFLSSDINQIKNKLKYKYDLIYIENKKLGKNIKFKKDNLSIVINNERMNKFKITRIGIGKIFPIPILINLDKNYIGNFFDKKIYKYNDFKINNILIKSHYKFNNYIYNEYKIYNKLLMPIIKINNIFKNNIYNNLLFFKEIKYINKVGDYTYPLIIKKIKNWYYLLKRIKNIKYGDYGVIKNHDFIIKMNKKSSFIYLENIAYCDNYKKINLFFQGKYFLDKNINLMQLKNVFIENKVIKKNYIFNILNNNNLFIYMNNDKNINFLFLYNTKWIQKKGEIINNIIYNNHINYLPYFYNIKYKEKWVNIFIKSIAKSTSMVYMFVESFYLLSSNIKNIGGPITVFTMAHESIDKGIGQYIFIMAFISINLGVMNLFPIPLLDGGHIIIFIIEGFLGRSIPPIIKKLIFTIGMIIMMSIIFLAIIIDIFRFF